MSYCLESEVPTILLHLLSCADLVFALNDQHVDSNEKRDQMNASFYLPSFLLLSQDFKGVDGQTK